MDEAKLRERLLNVFLDELEEHVQELNRNLLALESAAEEGTAGELVHALFRSVHSLKGAARSVGIEPVEQACHRLEDIFGRLRDAGRRPDDDLLQLLLAAADGMEATGRALRSGGEAAQGPLPELLPLLERAAEGRPARPPRRIAQKAPGAPDAAGAAAMPARERAQPADGAAPVEREGTTPGRERELIRVPSHRLDGLLDSTSELLIAQGTLATLHDRIGALSQFAHAWQSQWRRVQQLEAAVLRRASRGTRREQPSLPGSVAAARRGTGRIDHWDNLAWMSRELDQVVTRMGAERRTLERNVAAINADVRQVRLQPIGSAYEGLDRAVRDLARAAGKNARLLLRDRGAEVDRSVIESLKDPLLHLVRNAVDHGIETPEERRAASKPEQGMVGIAAAVHGDQIEIVVADDGRGLDVAAVMARAEKLGLTVGSDAEAADVIFVPGFSTAPLVTSISGRGVGLDVVRSNVERQRGTIRVDWTPGGGTRFEIRLPLTLTTLRALHVRAGMATFLIDSAQVRGLVRIGRADVERMEGRDTIAFDGENVPVVLLADALGLEGGDSEAQTERVPAVVLGSPGRLVALVVDELAADGEVTVKPLSRRLSGHPLVNAATILPDGSVGPIVRPAALVAAALGLGAPRTLTEVLPAAEHGPAKRLLVVDDSVTIRTHEAAILEAAGYEVAVAPDGVAGWQSIQERPPDLVVTDVEMPRMDGFTLVETIRGAKRFADLPVILVTALETDEHKRRGMDVGANAYLPKSSFDQRLLLQTIEQLLSGGQKIRVVIAEDSRTVRQLIESILDDDPKIEVVGRASNGIEAIRLAKELKPDVITMDVNMPLMGGLDATREIMIEAPTRIIIISGSIDVHEIEISMNALRMGAISVVRKPLAPGSDEFTAEARKLVATVKNLAEVKVVRRRREPARRLPPDVASAASQAQIDVVALGTSTGGPATLAELLGALPTDFALPILVVQHIAHGFVHGMASWLNGISPIRVKVAEQGEPLAPRTVYLAEDDRHLEVKTRRRIGLSQGPLVGGFRPSISHLFDSVRDVFGSAAAGVLLTGMGRDGAEGLLRLRLAGAVTVSQTPESCIVYGMPREAELLGAAEHVLEPRAIATLLVSLAAGKRGEHER